jgi:hypothetical protein
MDFQSFQKSSEPKPEPVSVRVRRRGRALTATNHGGIVKKDDPMEIDLYYIVKDGKCIPITMK